MEFKLIDKKQEARGTVSFFLEPKNSSFTYLPGQYFYFTIPKLHYPDSKGNTRHFTLSSSPTEGNIVRVTTRIRESSGFKLTLNELPIGALIEGEGPDGEFILDESEKGPHIFLAGGIGITPFRSMAKYVADKDLDIPINLIYSNSIPEEIAFREELEKLSQESPVFQMTITVSKPEESREKWFGQTGRINDKLISELIGNWRLKIGELNWWISGPEAFVLAMKNVLESLAIPSGKIRSEEFEGY